MNDFEKIFEPLQDLEHHHKKMIMWIGIPIAMAIVVLVWISYTDFSFKSITESQAVKDEVSSWDIIKNGLKVTIQDAGDLFNKIKEKVGQTNSFEVKPSENEIAQEIKVPENQQANIVNTLRIDAVFQENLKQKTEVSTTSATTTKIKTKK